MRLCKAFKEKLFDQVLSVCADYEVSIMEFNSNDMDWIEFGISLGIALGAVGAGAGIRYLSTRVLRIDAERSLLRQRGDDDGHVIVGEFRLLSLLGAPHVLRTRSTLGFCTLVSIIVATTALSITSLAFSGSRRLRSKSSSVKVTAVPGPALLDEDRLEKYGDWFRSSGAISFCQRRSGSLRFYYQPFVELSADTKLFCGKLLPVKITHESEERLESVKPSMLRINQLKGVTTSTPQSNFITLEINLLGSGLLGVCNTGMYYRGVRSGRISQSCAFTTKTSFILGGYLTNATPGSGPGELPSISDVEFFDSYHADLGTELTKGQLMQALTLWDLGSMSEVEVAVLSTLRLQIVDNISSFSGRFERLQVDWPLLAVGATLVIVVTITLLFIDLWDKFNRPPDERFRTDVSNVEFVSRTMRLEATNTFGLARNDDSLTRLAIRDVSCCICGSDEHNPECEVLRLFHVGSSSWGRPIKNSAGVVISQLNS